MAWWIFQSLVTTAALAALVAVVCRFAPIGPVARHALWVLVLVKFLMPPLVVWPWAAPDPLGLARNPSAESRLAADVGSIGAAGELSQPRDSTGILAAPDSLPVLAPLAATGSIPLWTLCAFVWIAGSLCIGVVEVVRQVRLARRVRLAGPADLSITRRVDELASALGLTPVPVVALDDCTSPAVWCVGPPRLLWPANLDAGSPAGIDGVIVHELAHIKRRDHIVGWLELIAGLVWWWNPLFWSVQRARREQAELACDAWVISALPDGRRAYAESLLALSSPGAPAPPPIAAVIGVRASSRRALERRLVMIMNGRASLRLPSAGLLALALLAAATLPAWATGSTDDSRQQPQAIQPPPPTPKAPVEQTKPKPIVKPKPGDRVIIDERMSHQVPVKVQEHPPAKVVKHPELVRYAVHLTPRNLTDEGQKLVTDYSTEVDAIQKEMQEKLEARREAAIQALQALQDQYTKAGKLDEAVAIRDYLKAGGPGASSYKLLYREKK